MATPGMTGGDKLQRYLQEIAANLATLGTNPSVRIGFLEGSIYDDGTPVAQIAAINEFGATINREPSSVTIYRIPKSGGGFLRGGKFVKRRLKSAVASTHAVGAYSITIPPRPFFRSMIKAKAPTWSDTIAAALRLSQYNAGKTLKLMGELISAQLRQSIRDTNSPPNAPSTIARKKAAKPLIDTGFMFKQVDYETST